MLNVKRIFTVSSVVTVLAATGITDGPTQAPIGPTCNYGNGGTPIPASTPVPKPK